MFNTDWVAFTSRPPEPKLTLVGVVVSELSAPIVASVVLFMNTRVSEAPVPDTDPWVGAAMLSHTWPIPPSL